MPPKLRVTKIHQGLTIRNFVLVKLGVFVSAAVDGGKQ